MAFSEEIKLRVKKKAMFQCCRCHETSVEIHHIIPQEYNGSDTEENAAPLCPNCHSSFGGNPEKRKEITQMRDNWYETVERMYSGQASALIPLIEKLSQGLQELKKTQSNDVSEIKSMLKQISNSAIDSMTLGTANVTASNLVKASGASLSNINIDDISELVLCQGCGKFFLTKSRTQPCPGCGSTKR